MPLQPHISSPCRTVSAAISKYYIYLNTIGAKKSTIYPIGIFSNIQKKYSFGCFKHIYEALSCLVYLRLRSCGGDHNWLKGGIYRLIGWRRDVVHTVKTSRGLIKRFIFKPGMAVIITAIWQLFLADCGS